MFNLRLEDGYFLTSESMELCLDLRIIDNCNLQEIILQHFYLSEVQLLWSNYYFRTI